MREQKHLPWEWFGKTYQQSDVKSLEITLSLDVQVNDDVAGMPAHELPIFLGNQYHSQDQSMKHIGNWTMDLDQSLQFKLSDPLPNEKGVMYLMAAHFHYECLAAVNNLRSQPLPAVCMEDDKASDRRGETPGYRCNCGQTMVSWYYRWERAWTLAGSKDGPVQRDAPE